MSDPKPKTSLRAARAVLVIAGSFVAANARESRDNFGVSATVKAMARLELRTEPMGLRVSADDLERGYIDVSEPTSVTVRSNSALGYALDVKLLTPIVSGIVVRGLDAEESLGAGGGTIVQHWDRPHVVDLSLTFRLVLAKGSSTGGYPWPMALSVRPLEFL